jgi:hypothetical protein
LKFPDPQSQGRVSGEAQIFHKGKMITTNSGFGGVNIALVLEKV